jgi:hypothetical protein
MPVTLTIRDETTQDRNGHAFTLYFPAERITVRELIRSRVYQEVGWAMPASGLWDRCPALRVSAN